MRIFITRKDRLPVLLPEKNISVFWTTWLFHHFSKDDARRKSFLCKMEVTPDIALRVQQLQRQNFTTERVISLCFPSAWPARFLNLTPCDFRLWGYLKSKSSISETSGICLRWIITYHGLYEAISTDMLLFAVVILCKKTSFYAYVVKKIISGQKDPAPSSGNKKRRTPPPV